MFFLRSTTRIENQKKNVHQKLGYDGCGAEYIDGNVKISI